MSKSEGVRCCMRFTITLSQRISLDTAITAAFANDCSAAV